MFKEKTLDMIVIGAGPIGIETAIELRRRGVDARVFDAGAIGHTISWWAPHTRWFSSNDRIAIAGVPLHTIDQAKSSREEYLNYLRLVVDQYQVPISTFSRAVSIQPIEADSIETSGKHLSVGAPAWRIGFCRPGGVAASERAGESTQEPDFYVDTRAVVLAIGGTDFPNRLGVPGEELPHVDGYLREIHRYHARRVLIVGGRNSAVEAAIRLHRGGAHVSLCYHGEQLPEDGIKYWLRPEIEGLARSGSIETFFRSRVVEITGQTVRIETLGTDGAKLSQVLPFDDVLTLIGYRQDKSLLSQLGIISDSSAGAPIYDPDTMQTSREGIYVAGTAVGGTQSSKYQVFLENCHDHAGKIADHVCQKILERTDGSPRRAVREDAGLRQRIAMQPES